MQKSREVQLVIKTRDSLFKSVESFFKKNHPYDVPEIIGLPVQKASLAYADWLIAVTKS